MTKHWLFWGKWITSQILHCHLVVSRSRPYFCLHFYKLTSSLGRNRVWGITFTFLVQRSSTPGPAVIINWLWSVTTNMEAPAHDCSRPSHGRFPACKNGGRNRVGYARLVIWQYYFWENHERDHKGESDSGFATGLTRYISLRSKQAITVHRPLNNEVAVE